MLAQPPAGEAIAIRCRLARYTLAAIYGVIAARVFCGWYFTPVEPAELAVNAFLLWQLWLVRGDMSLLLRAIRALQAGGMGIGNEQGKENIK